MTNKVTKLIKIFIFILFVIGFTLTFKNKIEQRKITSDDTTAAKALVLKKYLLKFQKPERVEIIIR